jgi:GTP-binding protein
MPRTRHPVPPTHLRNVAIIAHVDHGKTTLVDQMLYQSGLYRNEELDKLAGGQHGLILDSNDLERERGITILSKNCSVTYQAADGEQYRLNLIDTPGHADFGGEVERVLGMANGTLLLVDAFEGPMPQTRFVLQKSLERGLKPVLVVNKVDRPDSRPQEVVDEVFDLLVDLDAPDDVLDFPILYASGRQGWATADLSQPSTNLIALFEAVVKHVPAPDDGSRGAKPLQMQVTTLDYSDYVGRIAIGRVQAGKITKKQRVAVIDHLGEVTRKNVTQIFAFEGLDRVEVDEVTAGDLCAVIGLEPIEIGDTIADADDPHIIPHVHVDEPTLHMMFRVNDGPLCGRDGNLLTSRQIGERLDRELRSNVALRVAPGPTQEQFRVSGRGMMHLGILIENMRREGFELCVGKPQVIYREINGEKCEPIEQLVVDCPDTCQSAVMALLGDRRAELVKMGHRSSTSGFVHMEFKIPAKSLMGLKNRMLNATKGEAIMHHTLLGYEPVKGELPRRPLGVLISNETGSATAYSLDALYDRGVFFVRPGDPVYEGQVIGENCRAGDLVVNIVRAKKLTNVRAAGKDENAQVRPVREMSLEGALEYIEDDELVEITPKSVRIRKELLMENDRKREARKAAAVVGV